MPLLRSLPLLLAGFAAPALAGIYTVTNSNDAGPGSLRAAVDAANANPGVDRIEFAIPGNGPHTIFARSSYVIDSPIEIDGYSQPGSRANDAADQDTTNADIRIVIDASTMTPGYQVGMQVPGTGALIRGLAFVRGSHGLIVRGHENRIEGNFFGFEPDGETTAPLSAGVQIYGEFNLVGGLAPAQRNLFGGYNTAIHFALSGAIRNAVYGNLIGVNRHGQMLGNVQTGIAFSDARLNRVGDYAGQAGNLIVGHTQHGVNIMRGDGNAIVGNRIYGNAGMATVNNRFSNDPPCHRDDPLDADDGSNDCMNWPIIDSARYDSFGLRVAGRIRGEPNQMVRVALYGHSGRCTTAAGGEGDHYLGYLDFVHIDADGNGAFLFYDWNTHGFVPRNVTAVIGREELFVDSTSDYSPCVEVELADRLFRDDFE